jgi:hypothetical protein
VERKPEDEPAPGDPRCANVKGFSVHVNVAIKEHRREQLDVRLCFSFRIPPRLAFEAIPAFLDRSAAPPALIQEGQVRLHSCGLLQFAKFLLICSIDIAVGGLPNRDVN